MAKIVYSHVEIMLTTQIKEKREHQRHPVEHDIRIMFTRGQDAGGPRELTVPGRIIDQSSGGFCVATPFYIGKGDLLKASDGPADDSDFYFDVRWVYALESGYVFGCNFVDLSDNLTIH